MAMDTNKIIYYYSVTGKTEAILENIDIKKIKLNNCNPIDFNFSDSNDFIIIGSPTYGRGIPPLYFKKIITQIKNLKGKKIGLFGSGNTIYGDDYCGALDLLEELLKENNEIVFKYKFEGMPQEHDFKKFEELLKIS